ncbi:hypothetical protein Cyrtocomes_00325 [Candidatus Cyrtobacter comes]|uniref:Uncharacterized protein n=1 Tax=Candidatus Cyrtobacter comes TaxID=675776 RepID=A0ABU5L757_9RICK|nr:hypothetical protein [Candidatus Cyrtobacter comes]MDZ5761961.1 hypothetical protein [Candidatus Cyrtobacter comes]
MQNNTPNSISEDSHAPISWWSFAGFFSNIWGWLCGIGAFFRHPIYNFIHRDLISEAHKAAQDIESKNNMLADDDDSTSSGSYKSAQVVEPKPENEDGITSQGAEPQAEREDDEISLQEGEPQSENEDGITSQGAEPQAADEFKNEDDKSAQVVEPKPENEDGITSQGAEPQAEREDDEISLQEGEPQSENEDGITSQGAEPQAADEFKNEDDKSAQVVEPKPENEDGITSQGAEPQAEREDDEISLQEGEPQSENKGGSQSEDDESLQGAEPQSADESEGSESYQSAQEGEPQSADESEGSESYQSAQEGEPQPLNLVITQDLKSVKNKILIQNLNDFLKSHLPEVTTGYNLLKEIFSGEFRADQKLNLHGLACISWAFYADAYFQEFNREALKNIFSRGSFSIDDKDGHLFKALQGIECVYDRASSHYDKIGQHGIDVKINLPHGFQHVLFAQVTDPKPKLFFKLEPRGTATIWNFINHIIDYLKPVGDTSSMRREKDPALHPYKDTQMESIRKGNDVVLLAENFMNGSIFDMLNDIITKNSLDKDAPICTLLDMLKKAEEAQEAPQLLTNQDQNPSEISKNSSELEFSEAPTDPLAICG